MKEILLGIAISFQTLRGCIAQEIKLPQYDTQPPTNELLKHARTYTWKAYYREFTNFVFENELDDDTRLEFESDFKKITETVTGKTLLCRILIELRRRENDPKLNIKFGNMWFEQSDETNWMSLNYSTKPIHACTIDLSKKRLFSRHLKLSQDIEDNRHIHLFHELCHWFHSLQAPKRKQEETEFRGEILDYHIGRTYFDESFKPKLAGKLIDTNNEGRLWYLKTSISFEEMRTILGVQRDLFFKEGDDLCENLYRIEIGAPLRFGHLSYTHDIIRNYEANIHVIKKVIETTKQNYAYYLE